MNLLKNILRRPVAMSMFALMTLAVSAFFGARLPVELSPDIEFPKLTIRTQWSGASSEMMAEQVTAKIEEACGEIKGIKKINSISRENVSLVDIEFERELNTDFAKLELAERLETAWQNFPVGAGRPTIQKFVPKEFRELQGFLTYQFFPKQDKDSLFLTPSKIKALLERELIPKLSAVKGIGEIKIYGAEEEIIKIEINATALTGYGLSMQDIEQTLAEYSLSQNLGKVNLPNNSTDLRTLSIRESLPTIEALKKVIIKSADSQKNKNKVSGIDAAVRLSDVASVRYDVPEAQTYFRINAKSAVTLEIGREPFSNILTLSEKLEATLNQTLTEKLPQLAMMKELDRSERLRAELENLSADSVISIATVAAVLFIFLRSFSLSLVVILNIVFSVAVSILSMSLLGYSLNIITISGLVLVFGILTDNAIVVIDNIYRTGASAESGIMRIEIMTAACQEIFLPVLASTLTTIGALLPVLFLPDELRLYFQAFVVSVSVSIFASMIIAFTLIPSLIYSFNLIKSSRKSAETGLSRIETWFSKGYILIIGYILDRPKRFIVLTVWMFGIPLWLLPDKLPLSSENISGINTSDSRSPSSLSWIDDTYNWTFGSERFLAAKPYLNYVFGGSSYLFYRCVSRSEFFGSDGETTLEVSIELPQGVDPEKLSALSRKFEERLLRYSTGIKKFVMRAEGSDAFITVYFTETAGADFPYIVKSDMTAIGARIGGATIGVYGFGPGFYSGGNSVSVFRIKALGYNYERLKEYAEKFKSELEKNPRVDNCRTDKARGYNSAGKEVVLSFKPDAIARYRVSPPEIFKIVQAHSKGESPSYRMTIAGKAEKVEVKFAGEKEFSITDLERLALTEKGKNIKVGARLGDFAETKKRTVMSEILRENQQYQRWITFDYKGRFDFGQRFLESLGARFLLPAGYTIDTKPSSFFVLTEQNSVDLLTVLLFSVLIIFMVTASLYESFIKPLIILAAIPMSLIGVFFAFYITDAQFGRGGYAALILLSGIVVNISIVLIDFIVRRCKAMPPQSLPDLKRLIETACAARLRPILITTLLTVVSLAPLLLRSARSSLWYGLTVGAIGGMVSATLLVLFVVPAIYIILERRTLRSK